jgi:hypothetical protein
MMRNLQAIEQVSTLQQSADYFQIRAAEFEDKHHRDPLAGVFNRGHLDQGVQEGVSQHDGWQLAAEYRVCGSGSL